MNKIKILSSDLINKIAAGEVIERPASVVKELVENSIDAGAKYIKIIIEKSGRELISVTDDGSGMTREDAVLSVERHSTSKISDINDLDKIFTLGFRGEALPSIAAVSSMKITTKVPQTQIGITLEIENGKIINLKDTGTSNGTTIRVKNIFQNVPARLKFLKTDNTEKNKIISLLTDYAVVNYDTAFSLTVDGKELFSYSPVNELTARLAQVFGNKYINELIEIKQEHEQISIYGFISKPDTKFLSRNRIFISVNKRPISSRMIVNAVKHGYGEFLKNNENPAFFLMLKIKPDIIDVNVHPTKREIRFKDEGAIYSLIHQTVRSRLISKESIPEISYIENQNKTESRLSSQTTKYAAVESQTQFEQKKPTVRYLGRIFELYILAQENENLFIVDQHAAQEKILYEKFRKNIDSRNVLLQDLLIPLNIELSPKEFDLLSGLKDKLAQIGFITEEFGRNSFVLKSVPAVIGEASSANIIAEIIRQRKVGELSEASDKLLDNIIMTACKTAIKSGDRITDSESIKLLEELFECANPFTCPHGRPTIIKITKHELDKKFQRI